ncbi:MAG: protein translocase subunit SecF [bacterium]|nr:protein translocase subunit SecF [bacterium]
MVNFIKYRKIYYLITGALLIGSIASFLLYGFNYGIEFTGGSILELSFSDNRPSNQEVEEILKTEKLDQFNVQPVGEKEMSIRLPYINEAKHQDLKNKLKEKWNFEEISFEGIGSVIGAELKSRTKLVVALALIAIIFYITLSFKQVSYPIKSWQYGVSSLFTIAYDLIIVLGVFSVLGHFYNISLTIPIITALLMIVGYSINNTVVVFDRIRENSNKYYKNDYQEIVNVSLNQTLFRSLGTSLTTLFPLLAIFFLAGQSLKYFSLALILGISVGAFSSLFLTSSVLVSWYFYKTEK